MKIFVTGCAGFIGYHLCQSLLRSNFIVYAIDNLNSYYDPQLKKDRLKNLKKNKNFYFYKCNLSNLNKIQNIISVQKIKFIIQQWRHGLSWQEILDHYEYKIESRLLFKTYSYIKNLL